MKRSDSVWDDAGMALALFLLLAPIVIIVLGWLNRGTG